MHLIAYFTSEERRLFRWQGGALHAEGRFSADDQGLAAWRACLARKAGARLTIVADADDEEFHEERVPRLRGRDRRTVIERRLAQRFPNGRLVTATSLGVSLEEPEKESLQLVSLTDERRVEAWLDAAHVCGVRLAGLTSTAWLIPALLARHADRDASGLVISVHSRGLRECFLQRGQVRFARFVPLAPCGVDAPGARLRDEIEQLISYLAARRLLANGANPLSVTVIAREAQRPAIEAALRADARLALRLAALEPLAGQIGLRSATADLGAEQLLLALAAKWRPRERFLRLVDRRRLVQWRARRALFAFGASAFAASVAIAGVQWLQLQALRDEVRRIRFDMQQATGLAAPRAAATGSPQREVERLAVEELRRLAAGSAAPEAALAHLSRALAQSPRIELEALTWSVPAATAGAMSEPAAQTLEVRARIQQRDLRAQSIEVARFAAALQAASGWQIVRTRLPFDWTPQGTLRGGETVTGSTAQFTIVIARPLG